MAARVIGRLLRGVRAGQGHSVWNAPGLRAPEVLRISSDAFENGGPMAAAHAGAGVGGNVSPRLSWEGVPEGTVTLLFVMEDTDVPLPRPVLHTVALIDPALTGLDEGALRAGTAGVRLAPAAFGRLGYAGPRPVPGHGPHHYGFMLYALDAAPGEHDLKSARSLLAAAGGHVLGRGRLVGAYER